MKNTMKIIIIFCLGMIFESILLALRMLNTILKREAIFYIENYSGLYFIFQAGISLGFLLISVSLFLILEYIFKSKKLTKRKPTRRWVWE